MDDVWGHALVSPHDKILAEVVANKIGSSPQVILFY